MAFEFSLATVLRVRGIVEEREERLLQKILFDISQARQDLEHIDVQILEAEASRVAKSEKPLIGLELHASYGEVMELKQRRKDHEEQHSETRIAARQAGHRLRGSATKSRNAHRYAPGATRRVRLR